MDILKSSTIIVCALTLVVGCGKGVPDCSDSDTKELVLQIFSEKQSYRYDKKRQVLSVENIREVDINDKTGSYTCEAEIYATYSDAAAEAESDGATAAVSKANADFDKADADANDARANAAKAADAAIAADAAQEAPYTAYSAALVAYGKAQAAAQAAQDAAKNAAIVAIGHQYNEVFSNRSITASEKAKIDEDYRAFLAKAAAQDAADKDAADKAAAASAAIANSTAAAAKVANDELDKTIESRDAAAHLARAAHEAAIIADNDPKIVAAKDAAVNRDNAVNRAYGAANFIKKVNNTPPSKISSVGYTTELTSDGKLYVTLRLRQ